MVLEIHRQKGNLVKIRRQPALSVVELMNFQVMLFTIGFLGQRALTALLQVALPKPALLIRIGQVMTLAESSLAEGIGPMIGGLFG